MWRKKGGEGRGRGDFSQNRGRELGERAGLLELGVWDRFPTRDSVDIQTPGGWHHTNS
jgi:hypothetical protein